MTRARVEKLVRLARTSVEHWPKVASPESLVIVHVAGERDAALARIADLERAAETSRAEHAAALGLATARIRELEGERDRALDALRDEEKKTYAEKRETHAARLERDELLGLLRRWKTTPASERLWADTDAIVARIEKATKGTEQG